MPFPRLVLNFHDYCFLHVPNGPEPPNYASVCAPTREPGLHRARRPARPRLDPASNPAARPSLLTEFGATTDAADLGRITADADAHLTGWIYWQWLDYDDPTGSHDSGLWPPSPPTPAMLEVLSRPVPARPSPGSPTATSFDPASGRFTLTFRADPRITEPTVIFVPVAMHYPEGYCAAATGARITSAPGAGTIDVENGPTATNVSVTVTPGAC